LALSLAHFKTFGFIGIRSIRGDSQNSVRRRRHLVRDEK
jgi:hypothetical protein